MSLAILEAPMTLPFGVLQRRYGERNIDQSPVLAATDGFVMIDALTPTNATKNFRFLIHLFQWNQDRHRLADDLLSRVAEDALGTAIPAGDNTVEVLADDGVVR